MAGVVGRPQRTPYQGDGYETATNLSRDLVFGDAMVYHPSLEQRITLSTGPSEVFAGIVSRLRRLSPYWDVTNNGPRPDAVHMMTEES